MTTARQIAESLTDAQREALLIYPEHKPSWDVFTLIWEGLIRYRPKWFLFGEPILLLSRKGRKVRAELERMNDG